MNKPHQMDRVCHQAVSEFPSQRDFFKPTVVVLSLSLLSSMAWSKDNNRSNKNFHNHNQIGLKQRVKALETQINTIELTPGPQGESGPQGEKGLTGLQGTDGAVGAQGPAGGARTQISVDPPGLDDDGSFYSIGTIWVDTNKNEVYILVDDADGAAIWKPLGGKTYDIGDKGPSGGVVFHVTNGGSNGLEAAPEVIGGNLTPTLGEWGCFGIQVPGADGTAIGTGAQNTADILSADCSSASGNLIAAHVVANYSLNGFDEWFLPSKDELRKMYLNVISQEAPIPGINIYLSSSEYTDDEENAAWMHFSDVPVFIDGASPTQKSYPSPIRPVRAF